MKWYYGVIRITKRVNKKVIHFYEIHEIYEDSKGKLLWTTEPITPYGDTKNELVRSLSMMISDALFFPVYEIRKGKLVRRQCEKRTSHLV